MKSAQLQLCWRRDVRQIDRATAQSLLRDMISEGGYASLRKLLSETVSPASVGQLSDQDVLSMLLERIASGELLAFRRRPVPGRWRTRIAPATAPAATSELRATPELTWVEFQLVDEEGGPVPNERYRITLPDGTIKEGTLDYRGRVRFEHLSQAGDCTITFPDLDSNAWEPLGA